MWLGSLILSFIPGGSFIHAILGGLFHKAIGNGFQHGYQHVQSDYAAFQNRLSHDVTDNIIVVWFLALLTGYFLPFTQGYVEAGFTSMTASLPPSMQENFHIIVMAVFGVNTAKSVIKHTIAKSGTPEKKEEDPTRHFLFRKGEKNV